MTNDELEKIRARVEMHFQDGCYRSPRADYLCDVPALLDEVERLQSDVTDLMEAVNTELVRAARAEAHAERLAKSLQSIARNTCCDGCQEAALVARSALAAYRGVKDEACSRPSDALDAPVQPTSSHLGNGADQ